MSEWTLGQTIRTAVISRIRAADIQRWGKGVMQLEADKKALVRYIRELKDEEEHLRGGYHVRRAYKALPQELRDEIEKHNTPSAGWLRKVADAEDEIEGGLNAGSMEVTNVE